MRYFPLFLLIIPSITFGTGSSRYHTHTYKELNKHKCSNLERDIKSLERHERNANGEKKSEIHKMVQNHKVFLSFCRIKYQ